MKYKKQYKDALVIKQFQGNFTDGDFESIELNINVGEKVKIFHCCKACENYPKYHIKTDGEFGILEAINKESLGEYFQFI